MERDKSFNVIAIIAVIMSVVGITMGFAAFTTTLIIENSNATISAADEQTAFRDKLYWTAGEGTDISTGENTATISFISKELNQETGTITYTANVKNTSVYTAYMKTISVTGGLTCTASDNDIDATDLNTFCSALTAKVTFGGTDVTGSIINGSNTLGNGLSSLETPLSLAPTTGEKTIILTLSVADDAMYPDGNVTVTIPSIEFNYSTAS